MRLIITSAVLLCSNFFIAQVKQDTIKSENIEAVTIVAKKPTVETKVDRTVFNVADSSILAGNTTWDVLRMTPLVSIDNNDVVKSEGENVTVYINDRKSVFTGKELKEYLKSLPADNLMKIEVITNPSSRYETTGQVINIVLKKREDEGIKGSVAFTNTQNTKNSQYSNLNLNYHKKNFTQTITGSYNDNTNVSSLKTENNLFQDNEQRLIDMQSVYHGKMPSVSSTSELELNDKNNIGVIFEYFQHKSDSENNSVGSVFKNGNPFNTYSINQNEAAKYLVLNSNLFYKYYDKEKNRIFDVNVGFNYNGDRGDRHYLRNQSDLATPEYTRVFEDTQMRNYYVKLDYTQNLGSTNNTLETGVKFDFNNNYMPIDYFGYSSDILRNRFSYKDNLNAVYVNYSTKFFEKLDVRFGLRYEYMTYKLHQENDDIKRDESYGKLMPNALIKYTVSPNFNVSTSYNYSIWRPWYSEFNPFELPTSDGNFYRGNMDLVPNPNHRFTMKFGVYKKYFLSLGYSFTNQDYWTDYIPEGNKLVSFPNNFLGKSERYSVNLNTNQTFFKNKFNVNVTVGINYQDNSDFNHRNSLNTKDYITNFSGSANFTYTNLFDKNINISGWAGVYRNNNGNSIGNTTNVFHNLSVTKIFDKIGLETSLQLNNIFLRPVFDRTTYSQAGTFRNINTSDWYGASLTITKRFGNQKVKENTKTDVEKNQGGGK
ncbi:Outer membrane receptor proteins, mostly Fe transport [Soonwooa buanensis]|uniref:Outer membrane receptor proteins, mostly Fe transport n=1 Tax=Soonwooa buanensis TaxID=619805 RepID=A0A1T5GDW6_9FLAO|nr:outer membrane beta-barrel family protein [Soonwooa buanensis]SKC06644.1 Outer membrane receptor proteins, mostly Fe transport [Soonwooa buanensis]